MLIDYIRVALTILVFELIIIIWSIFNWKNNEYLPKTIIISPVNLFDLNTDTAERPSSYGSIWKRLVRRRNALESANQFIQGSVQRKLDSKHFLHIKSSPALTP